MKNVKKILGLLVALLGVYMVIQFGSGSINPPMVSGVAFGLAGVALFLS